MEETSKNFASFLPHFYPLIFEQSGGDVYKMRLELGDIFMMVRLQKSPSDNSADTSSLIWLGVESSQVVEHTNLKRK